MFNEEADDIGEVVAGQDTVTNRNADGEDTVLKFFASHIFNATNYHGSFY